MTLEIRPATREDIIELGGLIPFRAQAWSAFEECKLVAVGGFLFMPSGQALLFLDAKPGIPAKYPVTLVKMLRRVLRDAELAGRPHVYAIAATTPKAKRFLEHFGIDHIVEHSEAA